MEHQPNKSDDRKSAREARAQAYFEQDLKGQREWYSTRAFQFKNCAQRLSFLIIVAGATTTFLQIFGEQMWTPVATAALGALVILIEGWQRIARYSEVWISYRTASERMKREMRLYVNGAGSYRDMETEEEAYLQFVEVVEAVVAEEQQIYWQTQRGDSGRSEPTAPKPKG